MSRDDQRLAQMNHDLAAKRDDVEWIRDAHGNLVLVDREDWSRRRAQEIEEHRERERQRFNHRLLYPITATREAAE